MANIEVSATLSGVTVVDWKLADYEMEINYCTEEALESIDDLWAAYESGAISEEGYVKAVESFLLTVEKFLMKRRPRKAGHEDQ